MPTHPIWESDLAPRNTHAFALHVLQPLHDAGEIHLLDYTDLFTDGDGQVDCTAYFDLYHNNRSGQQRLAALLNPVLRAHFDGVSSVAPAETDVADIAR